MRTTERLPGAPSFQHGVVAFRGAWAARDRLEAHEGILTRRVRTAGRSNARPPARTPCLPSCFGSKCTRCRSIVEGGMLALEERQLKLPPVSITLAKQTFPAEPRYSKNDVDDPKRRVTGRGVVAAALRRRT